MYFTACPNVFTVNFEQVNAGWWGIHTNSCILYFVEWLHVLFCPVSHIASVNIPHHRREISSKKQSQIQILVPCSLKQYLHISNTSCNLENWEVSKFFIWFRRKNNFKNKIVIWITFLTSELICQDGIGLCIPIYAEKPKPINMYKHNAHMPTLYNNLYSPRMYQYLQ